MTYIEYIVPWVGTWAIVILLIRQAAIQSKMLGAFNEMEKNFSIFMTKSNADHERIDKTLFKHSKDIGDIKERVDVLKDDGKQMQKMLYDHRDKIIEIEGLTRQKQETRC